MIKWAGSQFQRLHMGSMVVGKFSIVLQIATFLVAISIKWDFNPDMVLIIFIPCALISLWGIGYIFDLTGLREEFLKAQFKGVIKTEDK